MSAADLLRLAVLAACWGLAFVFIRVAVQPLGAFVLVELRALLGCLVLLLYASMSGVAIDWRRNWRKFVIFGALGSAFPFTLIALAQTVLSASFAVVLVTMAPLFSALIAAFWLGDRMTVRKTGGLLLGLVGVAFLTGFKPDSAGAAPPWAVALALATAALYGVAGVYSKRHLAGIAPLAAAAGSQLGAALLLLPLALVFPPNAVPTLVQWLNVAALAVFSSALAFILYFRLIDSIGPVKTASVNYLTPLFGVAGGVLVLGEPLSANLLIGLAMILAGVTLLFGRSLQAAN